MILSLEEMITKRRLECLEYDSFDSLYKIDTKNPSQQAIDILGGIRPVSIQNDFKFPGSNGYMGISRFEIDIINNALIDLKVNISDYNFVDIGSGKGKAIFYNIIKKSGYKKYTGIEIDSEYNDIAISNLESFKDEKNNIEFFCMNALEYIPENTKCIYLFFQPFDKNTYQEFIEKNKESLLNNLTFIVNVAPYDNGNIKNNEDEIFKDFKKVFCLEYISIYSS
jgi:SAM-dependent methyltransferase